MNEFLENSLFAGVTISLLAYMAGAFLKKKFKIALLNPLLISIILSIVVLVTADIDYDVYNAGASYLSWFLTPATVCLAIPLYEQWQLLKKNWKAVMFGILAGTLTSGVTVFMLAKFMSLSHTEYVTLLPKSITTAIGMGLSEELGGYVTITVAVIVVTGVVGNMFGELVCNGTWRNRRGNEQSCDCSYGNFDRSLFPIIYEVYLRNFIYIGKEKVMKQTGCQEYQKVLSYFYDLVKDGTLTWGSKLPTERKIAEQLGIGRNSAREAICVLHGMGVVERKQGSGNYVAENIGQSFGSMIQMLLLLNGVTKSEICEFRRAMEKMAGNLLLKNGIDEKIKQKLSDLLHTMAELTGEPLAKQDKEFHDTLVFATKNNLLITIMQAVSIVYTECVEYDSKDCLLASHTRIYETLIKGDEKDFNDAIDFHYDLIEKRM